MRILALLTTPFLLFSIFAYAQEQILDGDLLTTEDTFDIYIVKKVGEKKFKRLILNPDIFNSYGHLSWDNVKNVTQSALEEYALSEFVIEVNPDGTVADPKVYRVTSAKDADTGERSWLNITSEEFESLGYDWDSIYKINQTEASEDFYPVKPALAFEDLKSETPDSGQADEEVIEEEPAISFSRPECDLEVPTSHATIQNAIGGATEGDTICLLAGIYEENIIIDGKNLTLSGSGAASTTIMAVRDSEEPDTANPEKNSAVVVRNVSALTLIEKVTIKNGNYYGIWVNNASPVIKNNIIKDNFAGMRILGSARPDIKYNVFSDNTRGGAIVHNGDVGSYAIDHNTFVDNGEVGEKATILFDSVFTGSPVEVTNNIFSGGVFGIHEPAPFNSQIKNNLFYNQSEAYARREFSNYNSVTALNDLSNATANISGDPLLDANHKPSAGSPALGAAEDRVSNIGAY